jgi:sortase B
VAEGRSFLDEEVHMRRIYELWFRRTLLSVAAAVFLFSTYKVTIYFWDGYENKKTYAEIRELYYEEPLVQHVSLRKPAEPSRQTEPARQTEQPSMKMINPKYNELIKQNEDIVGWIKIDDTKIDYPVLQADDNDFYLNYGANKEKNVAGSIFMDYRNEAGELSRNTVIYGHDMKNGTMFAGLLAYESRWNFENKAIIEFDTVYSDEKWIIFSAYTTDSAFNYIKTDFNSQEEYAAFLNTISAKSLHVSGVELTAEDRILTLSTCSSAFDNARFVVHAKLLKPQ